MQLVDERTHARYLADIAYFLSKKEAELLTLFIITGTYNVNKALNWKKNDTWYKVHSMLFRFMSGGFERLGEQNKKEEDGF